MTLLTTDIAVAVGNSDDTNGTVLRTTDGGANWTQITANTPDVNLTAVRFLNATTGFILSENGQILTTADGGLTWAVGISPAPITTNDLNDVHFPAPSLGAAVGGNGTILTTADSGATFTTQTPANAGSNFLSVNSADTLVGFVTDDQGDIDRSINGGVAWTEVEDGTLTGGGVTWTLQNSGTINDLTSVHFKNELVGIAVGENGTLIQTADGGVTRTAMTTSVPSTLTGVFLNLDNTGLAVGLSAAILQLSPAPTP